LKYSSENKTKQELVKKINSKKFCLVLSLETLTTFWGTNILNCWHLLGINWCF